MDIKDKLHKKGLDSELLEKNYKIHTSQAFERGFVFTEMSRNEYSEE